MGIESYLSRMPSAEKADIAARAIGADKAKAALAFAGDILRSADYPAGTTDIELENGDTAALFYQVTTAGFDAKLPAAEVKNGIEILREFTNAKGEKLQGIKIGDEVRVRNNFV